MRTLRTLIIENNVDDADLLRRHLIDAGYDVSHRRVETTEGIRDALETGEWDVILSDNGINGVSALEALEIVQESGRDIPFLIVSSSIGAETAASLMRHGAEDYLLKDDLSRLVPAVKRGMQEGENRREKREAELALAQSEERLKLALSAAGLGAWERDLITNEVFWSREASAMLGSTVGGAKLDDIHWQILEEDRESVRQKYKEAINSRQPITIRFRIKRRDGEIIWVSESSRCEYDATGVPLRLVGTIRDITRDKKAEDALIEAEERYRVISESASDAVISIDEDSTILYTNPATEKIFGYKPHDLVGKPLTDLMPKTVGVAHLNGLSRFIETGRKHVDWNRTETTGRRKDGTEIAIQISFGHHRKDGKHYFTGFIRDISEAKAAEAALRESEERLRAILNTEPECVKLLSGSGEILDLNPAGLRILEADSLADLRGKGPKRIVAPEYLDEFMRVIGRVMAGETAEYSYEIVGLKGTRKWLEMHAVPLRSGSGEITSVLGVSRDITEKQKSDELVRRSKQQYSDLINSVEGIVWEVDVASFRFTFVSKQAEAIMGFPVERWYEEDFWKENMHPNDREWAINFCVASTRDGAPHAFEYRMIAADGRTVWLRDIVTVVMENGAPATLRGIMVDVTERRSKDAAIQRQAMLIEQANEAIFVWDTETGILEWNKGCERLYGYTREEMVGRFAMDVLKSDLPFTNVEFLELLKANREWSGEVKQVTKDGRAVYGDNRYQLIDFEGRKVVLQTNRDTTTNRKSEEALKRSESRYRHLFENNPYPMWVYDAETLRFLAVNNAAVYRYGYSKDEFLAMTILDIRPDEEVSRARERAKSTMAAIDTTENWHHRKKDGSVIKVEITSHALDWEGRKSRLVLAHDITERLAAQEALRASEEQLRQSQKLESIGILAGGMAHDFNNMLTAINGYSDLILRKIDKESPIRKNVEEIKKAGERSAELTGQLLAFSRRQILQPKVLDLNETIKETTSLIRRLIGEDIQIVKNLEPELWRIEADPGQIAQVLMNLAVNSRDAMPGGGSLMIETSNVVLDKEYASRHIDVAPGPFVMLAVSDTGLGMDEQTRRRVFEPFFTTKPVGRGTGLGLSTVYGIVKQSGGNIWVYSEPGQGTTFKIYLPQAKMMAAVPDLESSQREMHIGSETILLVEDEESVRGLAREILESCGYTVIEASDGAEALEKFAPVCDTVAMLITDVIMPKMGGRELSERLKKSCPDIKILFTSGYTDDAVLRHGITDAGANFLQKPFTYKSLARTVRSMLDGE
jgi:two-component system, cell cycle sensor histidine kinase and response regulator CckA